MMTFRKCSVCGKEFIPAPMHMYKTKNSRGIKIQCSYTCYRKAGGDDGSITVIPKPEIIGKSNICRRCGRKLKNPESIELGFGNTCYKKFMAESNYKPLFEVRKSEPGTKTEGNKEKADT